MQQTVLVRAGIVGMALTALITSTTWAQSQSATVPTNPKAEAPIDLTGYWVSEIVDEWRFRVKPEKGDIPFLPLNAEARRLGP
jgi:hypothetical protein